MKSFSIFLLSFLSFVSLTGQSATILPEYIFPKPKHCSAEAALLLNDLNAQLPLESIRYKYPVMNYGKEQYIALIIKHNNLFDRQILDNLGAKVNSKIGQILTIHIPTKNYAKLINASGIEFIETAKPIFTRLDEAIKDTRIDWIHQGLGLSNKYDGDGVVVGIIDFGFDYTHPAFKDPETGELRISRSWEQNYSLGPPPAGFTYGTELKTPADFQREKTDLTLKGHGTHMAAIATGSGNGSEGKYRGIAYKSDIILVSLFALNGKEGNNMGVIDGINYIKKYAESVGKPVVINLSLGHHTGPHDGTSLADQAIDAFSSEGSIVVGSVGNEGDPTGFYLHFNYIFEDEKEILSNLVWPEGISSGKTIVDIWGDVGKDFEVNLEIFNPKTRIREAKSESFSTSTSLSISDAFIIDEENDTLFFDGILETNPLNNRPHAQFFVNNTSQEKNNDVNNQDLLDNDFVQIRFSGSSGEVHAYAANNYGEAFFTDLSGVGAEEFIEGTRVLGGNSNSTMGELGGTANSIISVGGYNTRRELLNSKGETLIFDYEIGNNYHRSSRGPTHDGRQKPEIMAPSGPIISAENSFYNDFNDDLEALKISKGDGTNWSYSYRTGTSVAAPVITGIVALMLQADPSLTPEMTKEILMDNSRMDEFTGTTPNNLWGYGKVDAYNAMKSLEQVTNVINTENSLDIDIYPNPNHGHFWIKTKGEKLGSITILDASGRRLYQERIETHSKQINLNSLSLTTGVYFIETIQGKKMQVNKLIILN